MTESCLKFIADAVADGEVKWQSVLEVGALNVNGSARSLFEMHQPASYAGVDMQAGLGVDEVCAAEALAARFGPNSFDVVVSTEMLEHVFDWRAVVHNLKAVLRPGGLLFITTRSIGFGYHAYPYDFWRYQVEDMIEIFSDFEIIMLLSDPVSPGVFLKARKPLVFVESDLSGCGLYSMITRRRSVALTTGEVARFHFVRGMLRPFRRVERGIRNLRDFMFRRAGRL